MTDPLKLVMCRSAAEPPAPGAWRGFFCKGCGKEVQVSPTGRIQIDEGAIVVCNPCGLALLQDDLVRKRFAGFVINPAAQQQFDRESDPDERLK
jgi:hypothetical protein